MPKDVQTTARYHSSHMLAKYFSKFSKPGFNSTWIKNFQMFKLYLEKAEEPEVKCPTSAGSQKNQEFQKKIYVWFTDYAKAFDCADHKKNCGKFLTRWEYQTTWPASWEICIQVKRQQVRTWHGTMDWFQIGKEYVKAVYGQTLLILTYMQSTSWEMPGWMNHKLESRLPGEVSITPDTQMTPTL